MIHSMIHPASVVHVMPFVIALSLPFPRLLPRIATHRLREALGLLSDRSGRRRLWQSLRVRLFSRRLAFGLRRDLTVPFSAPAAKIPLVVRPLGPDDDLSFLSPDPGIPDASANQRLTQRLLLGANLPTCWVAADAAGSICYLQWLIQGRDNARVQRRWGELFPVLKADEALLEGAYTAESHRGQGVMAHAMAVIAAAGQANGVHYVVTFVDQANVASLKGCEKAGFAPYIQRRESWFLFRRRIRFLPLQGS